MQRFFAGLSLFVILIVNGVALRAQQPETRDHMPWVGPLPTPVLETNPDTSVRGSAKPAASLTLYSIGEPTDIEQEYLELLNRARMNPKAEGIRLRDTTDPEVRNAYYQTNPDGTVRWSVDTNYLATLLAAIPPQPPLAFHPQLIEAARSHSEWMHANALQDHFEGTKGPSDRVAATGYPWGAVGENIYAYARSVYHGHAGFEVDWGEGPFGMQDPAAHRLNNHSSLFREVGIGVVTGLNTVTVLGTDYTVGPQVVTVDFATSQSPVPLVTGVAYFDLNANGRYDAGEGIGGVRVDVSGANAYAVTSESGGYAVPTANGTRGIIFSADGYAGSTNAVAIANGANAKADLVLKYSPPVISGTAKPGLFQNNTYTLSRVPGATGYRIRLAQIAASSIFEGAETTSTNLLIQTDSGYAVIDTAVAPLEGTRAFHLVHPGSVSLTPGSQVLRFKQTFRGTTAALMRFGSMLGYATEVQVARLQYSTNGGTAWQDAWSQAGTGGKGETNFTRRSVSLAALTGKEFQLRFAYTLGFGSYYFQKDKGVGWYLDELQLSGIDVVNEKGEIDADATGQFEFHPEEETTYSMSAQARLGTKLLPPGPFLQVTPMVVPLPAVMHMAPPVLGPSGKLRLDFNVLSGTGSGFILEHMPGFAGGWVKVADATLVTNAPNSYSFRWSPSGSGGFLRVRSN